MEDSHPSASPEIPIAPLPAEHASYTGWYGEEHDALRHILEVLAAILVPCAIVFVLAWRISPPLDQDKYIAAVIDKHRAVTTSCHPRVLFVGGSSTAFGFEAAAIHPCATNLGLHGGTGLRFNLFEAELLAEAGDVVVFAPEADHFFGDTAQGDEALMQALAYIPQSERSAFARAGVVPAIRITTGLAQYHLLRLAEVLIGRRRPCPIPYCRAVFGEHGDIRPSALPPLHELPRREWRLDLLKYQPNVITMFAATVQRLRVRGVRVILLAGPVRATAAAMNARALDRLAMDFQNAGLTLNLPADMTQLREDELYDREQHANAVGRTRLTGYVRTLFTAGDRAQ